jgi:hypothetical protein
MWALDLNRCISKEVTKLTNKYVKKIINTINHQENKKSKL